MTKVEFLQGLVKVFGQVSVKDMMSLIFNKYEELSEQEQKEFCSWLAGPNPKKKKGCKYCDGSHEYRELEDKEVDAFVRGDNTLEVTMCFNEPSTATKMGCACALDIKYCPWCGRKLEEENEH